MIITTLTGALRAKISAPTGHDLSTHPGRNLPDN
jgi:hypothetical protein